MTLVQDQATNSTGERSKQPGLSRIEIQSVQPTMARPPCTINEYHEVYFELRLDDRVLPESYDQQLVTLDHILRTAWAIVVSYYAGVEDVSFSCGTNDGQATSSIPRILGVCYTRIDPKALLLDTILATRENSDKKSNYGDILTVRRDDEPFPVVVSNFSSSLLVNHQLGPQLEQLEHDKTLLNSHVLVQSTIRDNASISVSVRANALRISPTQVGDMAHTLEKVVNEIIKAHPHCLIEDLDICSQRDLKTITSWNESIHDPVDGCFHWNFQAVACRTPDATAICSWDRSFTYRELDQVSTNLANHLHALGVTSEWFVGICFNKTSMAQVCMLGILKAGGAFVAIDPSYPASRIRAIVEATKASIFIAEPTYCHLFDDFAGHVMAIDTKLIDELPLRPSSSRPQSHPSDAAYAVFTSGSTGVPKGIVIEHRSLQAATLALALPMQISSSSRVLQFAAYTFDVSYGDTFVTWAQGGCICIPSDHERINDLSGAIVRMNVNNACLIPNVARTLRPENVPCLKVLLLGGEALLQDNIDTWAEKVTLSVVYGPSECTVWCASLSGLSIDSPPNIIGRGNGARLWITNASNHDRLCPIGCVGELLIEGPGLARGYLDAEQTRNAFIENPSWACTKPGQRRRFYKTGDLVKYQPDGTLIFIGRRDTQVKLHGHRLELGEIEYHLSSHDLLKQSMILFPSAGKYRQKLVAIIVLKSSIASDDILQQLTPVSDTIMQKSTSEIESVKKFLSSRLPCYMLPHEWIVVEKIPLMVSGKMNRILVKTFVESLSAAPHGRPLHTPSQDSVSDKFTEDHLRQIWSQVLGINTEDIGLDSGFASLGGDSFDAMDLVARCKAQNYSCSVADALNDITIRQMVVNAKAASSETIVQAIGNTSLRGNQCKPKTSRPLVFYPIWWDAPIQT